MDYRHVVEPIPHSTTDGGDLVRGRGSATVEFRENEIGIWIAASIRSKTVSIKPIEIAVRKRNRRKFPNNAHSDTSQRDRSAGPCRAEWSEIVVFGAWGSPVLIDCRGRSRSSEGRPPV